MAKSKKLRVGMCIGLAMGPSWLCRQVQESFGTCRRVPGGCRGGGGSPRARLGITGGALWADVHHPYRRQRSALSHMTAPDPGCS
eukprot:s123_g21.t1